MCQHAFLARNSLYTPVIGQNRVRVKTHRQEGNMNILLVEDDATVAEMMCDVMRKWDQDVTLATSGTTAVKESGSQQFDLALLDIMLPDGFGYDFIPEMKKSQPDLKIITLTGHSTPDMEKRVRQHGITYYMAKPVNFQELKDIVDHISKKTTDQEGTS